MFFETSYASIFENGRWSWESAPGFDTAVVKAGYIPINYHVFGSSIEQANYYNLRLLAYFSCLAFLICLLRFSWKLTAQQYRADLQRASAAATK